MVTGQLSERKKWLKEEFGFTHVELQFIAKHKSKFYYYDENGTKGIVALKRFFIEKLGYDAELLRTLVVKYPVILSKEIESIEKTFEILKNEGYE